MSYVAHDESAFAPPAEVEEVELYHPKTWVGKYVWSQDAKVIAVQYAMTAIGIGLVALVLSWLMRLQLGYPNSFSFINPSNYLQFVTMHGMIMVIYLLTALFLGGFGNYLIPLMVGARDMVFPYVNMVSYWVYLFAVLLLVASFFVTGGPTGAGWTLYPPQAISQGTPGASWGIILMLVSLAFSAPVLVFRPSRGLHRRPAGLRHRLRPAQRPRKKKHLRLSHDGVGDPGHRRPELPGVGAPHVRQRHEPVLRLLF